MSTVTINLDLADDIIKEYQSHKGTYKKKLKAFLCKEVKRNTVPDFLIPDSDLTAEELQEEERELEARRPEIERRLREDKSTGEDIRVLLRKLDKEFNTNIKT